MNIHVHRVHMSLQGLSALAKKTAYLDKISVMNNVLEVWMEKWFVVTLIILSEQELLVRSGQIFKRTADNWAKSTKQKCIFLVTHLSYSHLIEVTWAGSRENNFHFYVEFSSKHLLACRWKVSLPMLARRRLDLQAGSVNVRSQETKHAYSRCLFWIARILANNNETKNNSPKFLSLICGQSNTADYKARTQKCCQIW